MAYSETPVIPAKARVRGYFDSVRGDHAHGWAFDPDRPQERLPVEIVCNGQVVVSGLADRFRSDLLKAGIGDGCCSFSLPLPPELFDGRDHVLVARVAGTGKNLGSGPHVFNGPRPLKIKSCFDGVRDNRVHGWAFDPDHPRERLPVEIVCNGQVVVSGLADRFRSDLLKAGIGDGCCSFSLPLPPELFDGRDYVLVARVAGTGKNLGGGAHKFSGNVASAGRASAMHDGTFDSFPVKGAQDITQKILLSDMIELYKKEMKIKNHDKAEEILIEGINSYPEDIRLLEAFADLLKHRKQWKKAALGYEKIFTLYGDKTPFSIFQKYRAVCSCINDKIFVRESWKKCCDSNCLTAQKSFNALLKGNPVEAFDIFSSLTRQLFGNDRETQNYWNETFIYISSLFYPNQELFPVNENAVESISIDTYKYKKIFVSGMGWSGSSALYDFFKEYHGVYPIKGEIQYIEGQYGLNYLYAKLDDNSEFLKSLLLFFSFACFGFSQFQSPNEYKISRESRGLALSKQRHLYAKCINNFVGCLRKSILNNNICIENFKESVDLFFNLLAIVYGAGQQTYVLVDNAIKVQNINMVEFIDNLFLFCTFRDPRSNFVALKYEFPGFNETVEQYIEFYRKNRKNYNKKLQSIKNKKSSIYTIQFEEFVLSDAYRRKLANNLGLRPDMQYKYFKPWESEKNVFLHETYPKQEEIKAIEQALAEYCIDVHKLKEEVIKKGEYITEE